MTAGGESGRGAPGMRIAFVHSFYRSSQPSGENRVVESEVAALQRAGHDVRLFEARTDDLEAGRGYRLASALRVATGRGRSPLEDIRSFRPDVVHVHNLFPNFGRRWIRGVRAPVVVTLHNYRPLCANGQLFRDGGVCTECPDGSRFAGVRHACYRDSRLATLPLAVAGRNGPANDPLLARADRVIVLSEIAARMYKDAGLAPDKMVVWPNFLRSDLDPGRGDGGRRSGWLYVGRLSPEKGILRLVERWPYGVPLTVMGDGPDLPAIRAAAARKRVEVAGLLSRSDVMGLMRSSLGLAVPSLWYESFPLVYAEAMATGLPVLAWEPNGVVGFLRNDGTGTATSWSLDPADAVVMAEAIFPALHGRCRAVFEERYGEAAYVARAEALYGELARVGVAPRRKAGRAA